MTDPLARPRRAKTLTLRPAALLALLALAVAPAAALAGSGGVGTPGSSTPPRSASAPAGTTFGKRVLRPGMAGDDVLVLNGIVSSKRYARSVPLTKVYRRPAVSAVRAFQARRGLRANGVVNSTTARQLTRSMQIGEASWYGPGLYGNHVACGGILRPGTIGVAHKTLPCGTKVTFAYRGRYIVARVIDRGPYVSGRAWDLTRAASDALGVTAAGVANVHFAIDQ